MKSCKEWIDRKRSQGESIHPFCDKGQSFENHTFLLSLSPSRYLCLKVRVNLSFTIPIRLHYKVSHILH